MFQRGKEKQRAENLIAGILDASELEIILVRDKDDSAVIVSETAKKRLREWEISRHACVSGLESFFFGFSSNLEGREKAKFNVKDIRGRTFEVTYRKILWLDDSPASLFIFNDIESRNETTKVLYNLAYLDYLTQSPNRLKLKEDFQALEPAIASGEKCGTVSILDFDNFKSVNDTYGHNIGDMMLQRFTEHLQNTPEFKGHMYRLGGDEFSFLFAENAGTHPDFHMHYEALLNKVLSSYTLPDIDMFCTVSIGTSCFPIHGDNLFALMRKADIALYKAKAAGGNRHAIFKVEDDIVQDLKDLYISIQPILDANGKTFGYELIDSGHPADKGSDTVSLFDFNRTLDILDFEDICSDRPYLISHSKNMLYTPAASQLKDKFIIQINIFKQCGAPELADYQKLCNMGFTLALNCTGINNLTPELMRLARYVKIVPHKEPPEDLKKLTAAYKKVTFIANQVDTPRHLLFAQNAGCTLFQGQYFKTVKPVTERIKNIEPLHINYYKLLKLTCTEEYVDFNEISEIISSDLAMSYRLLKIINSVGMGIKSSVSSISMALTYMGEVSLKKWIALLCLRGITPDKPAELVRISLIRAKFGENLAPFLKEIKNTDQAFMVGLLSLLHVALDKTQEDLLNEIAVADEIRESFLTGGGKYSGLLSFFRNYENSNWAEVSRFAKDNNIDNKTINEAYIAATKWCNELTKAEG